LLAEGPFQKEMEGLGRLKEEELTCLFNCVSKIHYSMKLAEDVSQKMVIS
jgi:hypothetical protein